METIRSKGEGPWTMTRDSFAALITRLGGSPFESGTRYEALRSRLILYFSRRCLDFPEDLADGVLDRLTRRLAEGTDIQSIEAFALGIARYVAQEQTGKPHQMQEVDETFFENIPAAAATQSEDERIAGMERCLARLPANEVALLRAYYLGESGGSLIGARKGIAEKLGLGPAAVRQRIFSIRRRLRQCIERNAETK